MTTKSQRAISVRPSRNAPEKMMAPIQKNAGDLEAMSGDEEDAMGEQGKIVENTNNWQEMPDNHGGDQTVHTDGRPVWEKVQEEVEDLNVRVARHFEGPNDKTDWTPPMVKTPLQPTKAEWLRHQLTHTPYAPWCKHCIAARAVRDNHQRADRRAKLVPDIDRSTDGPIKISMDYMYLHERNGRNNDDKWNPPYLVVVEHRHGRMWAYQTPQKGPNDEASWLPARLIQDWDNCGFKEMAIQLKTDQEPAMINLQAAIQEQRPKTVIPVNSPVGESESNGRVENAIRRVQEKTRALRHQLESNIKRKIPDSSPVMAWLVRWAAEVLSKYSCGDDGKSPHERLNGEKCTTPLVPFGESVMYLPLKTVRRDKGDVAKKPGIWLGIIARTQEVLIGTERGVIKCRTVTRLSDEERWNGKQTLKVKGTPWEPVPGRADRRIPVAIDNGGNAIQPTDDVEAEQWQKEGADDEDQAMEFRGGPDKFHVSRKAIEKYGPTEGCPACTIITRRGIKTGRVGVHHNNTCRERVINAMKDDPQYRQLMQKHQGNVDVIQHDM